MIYSLPYILLELFLLIVFVFQITTKIEDNTRKYINYSVVLIYILFFGLRGFIGWDWYSYYPFYSKLSSGFVLNKENQFDLGFVLYAKLLKNLFSEYWMFVLFNTCLDALLLYLFLVRYISQKYLSLGFALFLVFTGLQLQVDLLRNIKALFLFLYSLKYIEHRNPIKYFLLIIIAFYFHWSSLFFIPLYFFLHKKIPVKTVVAIYIVGYIIFLFQIEYFKPILLPITKLISPGVYSKTLIYLSKDVYSKPYGLTIGFFERSLMTLLVLFYYSQLTQRVKSILFVNSFLIYSFIYLYCSEITIVLQRVAGNFGYSYWILIPLVINYSNFKVKNVLIFFYIILVTSKITMMTNNIFYDYQSYLLTKVNSYTEQVKIFNRHSKELLK